MSAKVQRRLRNGKRRIKRRLARRAQQQRAGGPEFSASNIHYEFADRWMALLLPSNGPLAAKKQQLLRMEFTTFRRAMLAIPAQIVKTGRRILYRVLAWNPWLQTFFRLLDQLNQPLRC